jgi:hypothetical protein
MDTSPPLTKTQEIIKRWPSRQAMADDCSVTGSPVDLFAVHRWFQRSSIPGKHDSRLLQGAARRGFALTADELVAARSEHADQVGHGIVNLQGEQTGDAA